MTHTKRPMIATDHTSTGGWFILAAMLLIVLALAGCAAVGGGGVRLPFLPAPTPPPPGNSALTPLSWASGLAFLAAIACVFLKWPTQAIGLGIVGAMLVVLNLTLQTHAGLVALISLVVGVGAVVLVAGQWLGLWKGRKRLLYEASNGGDWTTEERETLIEAAKELA